MAALDLRASPFAILGVSPRNTQADVVQAEEEQSWQSEGRERELGAARSALTVAKERVRHEISWLPEVAPNRAREILRRLKESSVDRDDELVESVSGLSRVNLIAHLLNGRPDDQLLREELIDAHAELDLQAARNAIEDARRVATFPPIQDQQWKIEVKALRARHADILLRSFTRMPDGPPTFSALIEDGKFEGDGAEALLDTLVEKYDRWSEPHLAEIDDAIERSIGELRRNPKAEAEAAKIVALLEQWDRISQPVQLREQAQGLDEQKSFRIFKKLRDLAITLANDHEEYRSARQIASALQDAFPELPSVGAMLEEDLSTLDGLIEQEAEASICVPLVAAAEAAKARLESLAVALKRSGFRWSSAGAAGELHNAFTMACRRSSELSQPELPWLIARTVALALNNVLGDARAALILTEKLLDDAPSGIAGRLRDDALRLKEMVLKQELVAAVEGSNTQEAVEALDRLIALGTDEKREYIQLKTKLEEQASRTRIKRIGWATVIVIGVGVVLASENNNSSTYTAPTDSSDLHAEDYSEPTGVPDGSDVVVTGSQEDSTMSSAASSEEAPPESFYGVLSTPQLRYCRFESTRLDMLSSRVAGAMAAKFNERVSDYNSRCGSAQYASLDSYAIDAEVTSARGEIEASVQQILNGWSSSEDLSIARPAPVKDPFAAVYGSAASTESPEGQSSDSHGTVLPAAEAGGLDGILNGIESED